MLNKLRLTSLNNFEVYMNYKAVLLSSGLTIALMPFLSLKASSLTAEQAAIILNATIPDQDLVSLARLSGYETTINPLEYSGEINSSGWSSTYSGIYFGKNLNVTYSGDLSSFPSGNIIWSSTGTYGTDSWSSNGNARITEGINTFQVNYNSSLNLGTDVILKELLIDGTQTSSLIQYTSTSGTSRSIRPPFGFPPLPTFPLDVASLEFSLGIDGKPQQITNDVEWGQPSRLVKSDCTYKDLRITCKIKLDKPKPKPNGSKNKPRSGKRGKSKISYNSQTRQLSFTEDIIDFANLVGNDTLDPSFYSDPLLGATISVTDLQLLSADGNGFLFEDGKLKVSKGSQIFIEANIPNLLIDDTYDSIFGYNVWGLLDITLDDTLSPFLKDYSNDLTINPLDLPELFGTTSIPITALIANNESFETTIEGLSFSSSPSIPEPSSTINLLALGTLGAASTLKRKLKPSKSAEKETTKVG
jgi:hypothetical protein